MTKRQAWAGRRVTSARAHWRSRLPMPCRRCGKVVRHDPTKPHGGWTVGHIIDRALGGSDDLSNTWPEHTDCNLSAGGRLGAAMTNAARATPRINSERARGIRGL